MISPSPCLLARCRLLRQHRYSICDNEHFARMLLSSECHRSSTDWSLPERIELIGEDSDYNLNCTVNDACAMCESKIDFFDGDLMKRLISLESLGHFYQLGERVGLHLPHKLAAVCLHRDLANAELETYLFIQQAGDH